MLEVIGEALKMRLCVTDLTFEREFLEEDIDVNQQFQRLKEMNHQIHDQLSELGGAIRQVLLEMKL